MDRMKLQGVPIVGMGAPAAHGQRVVRATHGHCAETKCDYSARSSFRARTSGRG